LKIFARSPLLTVLRTMAPAYTPFFALHAHTRAPRMRLLVVTSNSRSLRARGADRFLASSSSGRDAVASCAPWTVTARRAASVTAGRSTTHFSLFSGPAHRLQRGANSQHQSRAPAARVSGAGRLGSLLSLLRTILIYHHSDALPLFVVVLNSETGLGVPRVHH